jgi:hypothetical protein
MQEYVVEKGLKPDIESLSRELVTMKASLEDSSRLPSDQLSEVEKLWALQVQELSYGMEDAVDDFILHVAGGNSATAIDANVFKKILGKATTAMRKVKDRRQKCKKLYITESIIKFVLTNRKDSFVSSSRRSCAQNRSKYIPLKIACIKDVYLQF